MEKMEHGPVEDAFVRELGSPIGDDEVFEPIKARVLELEWCALGFIGLYDDASDMELPDVWEPNPKIQDASKRDKRPAVTSRRAGDVQCHRGRSNDVVDRA